ncbi:MAG: MFS transporter, partial [Chloroflexota bacterium]
NNMIIAFLTGVGVMFYFWNIAYENIWLLSLAIILIEMILGGVIAKLLAGVWHTTSKAGRVALVSTFIGTIVANLLLFWWFITPGQDDYLLTLDTRRGPASVQAPNPALPGDYPVMQLTYGSGTDKWRQEFAEGAALITRSVDISSYVRVSGFKARSREYYWGFGTHDFPLNGRVWYPEGQGLFPLVLIVHGNHNMGDYSDEGYAYLGELLASRGYIFVSVDQNFFNGYITGGMSGENDGRAWLMLKHLELWRDWNADQENPFYGLVDMQKIALIGHSRGGEAVAHAALLNRLRYHPDNAKIVYDFNFGIQSVIAISPSDQQYQPADQPTTLRDINYFVLQGAHDADVSTYSGLRQFGRVNFTDPQADFFKAGLYIYQANHGQFNTTWGRRDLGIPRGALLNTRPLMDGDQQRQIAKVYISAFLDATLKGAVGYLPIFENQSAAGDWLPETLYISQYEDPRTHKFVTYEEDVDVTTTTIPGGYLDGSSLDRWREEELEFRTGRSMENQAAIIGWKGIIDRYTINLPEELPLEWGLDDQDYLIFSLADGRDYDVDDLLDFSIILKDSNGENASLPLSTFTRLLPQFKSQFTKLPPWEADRYYPREQIMESFRLPLSAFITENPALNLFYLQTIVFAFDQMDEGRIILDDIGFSLH